MRTCQKANPAYFLALLLLFWPGVSQAADIKERTLRFAFVQNIDNHWGAGAQKFADIVEKKSGGTIKVRLFPGGTLEAVFRIGARGVLQPERCTRFEAATE
jgi:TRAP-type transport system periplasmic protein